MRWPRLLIVSGLLFGPEAEADKIDDVSSASLGAYLVAATLLVLASRHDPVALVTFALLIAATVAIAWRTAAAAAAVPAAALLAVLVMTALGARTQQRVPHRAVRAGRRRHPGAGAGAHRDGTSRSASDLRRCSALPDYLAQGR